jgi:hypothetical protein
MQASRPENGCGYAVSNSLLKLTAFLCLTLAEQNTTLLNSKVLFRSNIFYAFLMWRYMNIVSISQCKKYLFKICFEQKILTLTCSILFLFLFLVERYDKRQLTTSAPLIHFAARSFT